VNPRELCTRHPVQVQAVEVWIGEAAATWAVRRTLELGYRHATGSALPTARDRDVPLRRILVWAAVSAAAVAVANVVVDRVALRHTLPGDGWNDE
jgi:hypothetical protein